MWYIVLKDKTNTRSKDDFRALIATWIKRHESSRNAHAYTTNLTGIDSDVAKPAKTTEFIEVVSHLGDVVAIAKVSITPRGVYLAEIVKHEGGSSDAMNALFSWAAHRAGPKKVTLVAAYLLLIGLYGRYGFTPDESNPQWAQMPPETQVNAPMTMTDKAKAQYLLNYREEVFWEMLPDLIGPD